VVTQAAEAGEPFSGHQTADMVVDRVYLGGPQPHWGADPLQHLLGVGVQGGIRARGRARDTRLVALRTSGADPDWPDVLDLSTGTVTYYGDNRRPGADLHQTPRHGNQVLRRTFDLAHGDAAARRRVPPYFFFEKAGPGREVRFRSVIAPGAPELTADEDLVAVWRSQAGMRFQNYRAKFTVLDIAVATPARIEDIAAGNPLSDACPGAVAPLGRRPPLRGADRDPDRVPVQGGAASRRQRGAGDPRLHLCPLHGAAGRVRAVRGPCLADGRRPRRQLRGHPSFG
jgi:Restriction endonuclease AspBHI N-terminal